MNEKKNWHNATLYIIKKKGLLMDFSGIVRNHGQNEHYSANIQYHVNNVISTYCHINVVATNEYVLSWVFYYNPSVRHYVYDIGLLELFYCGGNVVSRETFSLFDCRWFCNFFVKFFYE